MMRKAMLVLSCWFLSACFSAEAQETSSSIIWDEWGVPHLYGKTDEELFYLDGWAQMQLHTNLVLELYGRSRGRAAEYWGKNKLEEDIMVHTLGFPEIAREWTAKQDPAFRKLMEAFVRGLNAYAKAHPERIKPENRKILPMVLEDVNLHLAFVVFARFVGGEDLGNALRYPGLGSNAWAVGPAKSASGKAMLVQNPHLPWSGEFLFTEAHFNRPGLNLYGSTLVGLPGIAIGFNENLGWTHTNNTIDNADSYLLTIQDGGYLLDSQRVDFQKSRAVIKVKDSLGNLSDFAFDILKTQHGPVVKAGQKKAVAIRMTGADRPNMVLQWWRMGTAKNFEEFESALRMAQIPFWNVIYADKQGNIFYLFNGLVPKRSQDAWSYWNRVIPGGKSADIWEGVHSYDELPKVKNPKQGWLQNANDPPWTSTLPMALDRKKFPGYMSPHFMHFRAQRSAGMLQDDASITFDELVAYKLSTRSELADRILDDLFKAIDEYGTDLSREAKAVLEKWDRHADAQSEGMHLFYLWAESMNPYSEQMFAVKWDDAKPRSTPDGLSDPKKAVRKLDEAVMKIKKDHGKLNLSWGEFYRIVTDSLNLPGNGADGSMGVFRVTWPGGGNEKQEFIGGGDSWVGVIEFAQKVRAKVLLSYGNSSEPSSPYYGDQLKLFSKKKLRDAYFYREDVLKHRKREEQVPMNQ